MSRVTNVIVVIPWDMAYGPEKCAVDINRALRDAGAFSSAGAPLLAEHDEAYGGTKILEADVLVFALNHFGREMVREAIEAAIDRMPMAKRYKKEFQVLCQEQEEANFSSVIGSVGATMNWEKS